MHLESQQIAFLCSQGCVGLRPSIPASPQHLALRAVTHSHLCGPMSSSIYTANHQPTTGVFSKYEALYPCQATLFYWVCPSFLFSAVKLLQAVLWESDRQTLTRRGCEKSRLPAKLSISLLAHPLTSLFCVSFSADFSQPPFPP